MLLCVLYHDDPLPTVLLRKELYYFYYTPITLTTDTHYTQRQSKQYASYNYYLLISMLAIILLPAERYALRRAEHL